MPGIFYLVLVKVFMFLRVIRRFDGLMKFFCDFSKVVGYFEKHSSLEQTGLTQDLLVFRTFCSGSAASDGEDMFADALPDLLTLNDLNSFLISEYGYPWHISGMNSNSGIW